MEMTGTRSVPSPMVDVWQALNDPETLKACIVGCESIEPDGPDAYRMVMAAKVGPVSARFTGKMRLSDIDAPNAYTLRFEGSGGAAGFVNGEARVSLAPNDSGGTTLSYAAKAQVGGKLAQVGSRLIDGVAQKLTDDFFTRFVAATTPPVVAVSEEVPITAESHAVAPARDRRRLYWIVAVLIVAALAVLTYVRS